MFLPIVRIVSQWLFGSVGCESGHALCLCLRMHVYVYICVDVYVCTCVRATIAQIKYDK